MIFDKHLTISDKVREKVQTELHLQIIEFKELNNSFNDELAHFTELQKELKTSQVICETHKVNCDHVIEKVLNLFSYEKDDTFHAFKKDLLSYIEVEYSTQAK
jgi:hypothetical protein